MLRAWEDQEAARVSRDAKKSTKPESRLRMAGHTRDGGGDCSAKSSRALRVATVKVCQHAKPRQWTR